MVAIGNPESPLPEVPRFISMEIRALPVLPLIPHPTGSCRAPRERLHPGPNPEEKTGRTRHHSLEDRHTERLPSQAWSPSSPLAGKGLERGSHIPAPPVPLHTGLLVLQDETGDRQHVEEGHAHDVRDGVPLVMQALLEPVPEPALRSLDHRELLAPLPDHLVTTSQVIWGPSVPSPVRPQLSHCTVDSGWLIL